MNGYTTRDIELLLQKDKRYRIKVDILDKYWRTIGSLEGTTTNLNMSLDSDSEIRRIATMTLFVDDTNIVKPENLVWIDKYSKISLGVYDFKNKEYVYYNIGFFTIKNYQYKYSSDETHLQLSLLDLMAVFNEERGNQITTKAAIPVGITVYPCPVCGNDMTHTQVSSTEMINENGTQIPVINIADTYTCAACGYITNERPESSATYADITNAMRMTIERFSPLPYNWFSFDTLKKEFADVPYDLEYDNGTYPLKIISDLRDLYPNYQTYFDTDGYFVFSEIPTTNEDPISLDKDVMDNVIISEEKSADFGDVCNVHDVWGQSLEADRTAESTVGTIALNRTIYRCTFSNMNVLENDKTYCFTADIDNVNGADVQFFNGTTELTHYTIPLYVRCGTDERLVKTGEIKANVPYVIKIIAQRSGVNVYRRGILLGELQIRGICKTVSTEPNSSQVLRDKEFYGCDNFYYQVEANNPLAADIVGEHINVCYGGDYDNIYSTQLAFERGRYENYKTTRLNHNATLTTLIIPWIDVNEKIRYTSPITGEVLQYIVKKIDISFADGTMTLSLNEFYPYYPFEIN